MVQRFELYGPGPFPVSLNPGQSGGDVSLRGFGRLGRASPCRRCGPPRAGRGCWRQGCKIRSGRDRIIRIFESSEFGKNSVRIQEILLDFIRNSEMSRTFNISLKILRNSEKFSSESVQNSMKSVEKSRFLQNFGKKCEKVWRFFFKNFGFDWCKGLEIL